LVETIDIDSRVLEDHGELPGHFEAK
jgi:hypothetical protein